MVMRKSIVVVLFVVAAGLVFMSVGALSNIWSAYRDGPIGVYILLGGADLGLAALLVVAGILIVRR